MVAMGYGAEDVAFSADEQDRLALLQPGAIAVGLHHDIMMLAMRVLAPGAGGRAGAGGGAAGAGDYKRY